MPQSEAAKTELEFIDAVHDLSFKLGLLSKELSPILPIQIRLEIDKFQCIKLLLSQNVNMYQEADQLYDLTLKLFGSILSTQQEMQLRLMLAQSAFHMRDYETSCHYCLEILEFQKQLKETEQIRNQKSYDDVWELVIRIADEPNFHVLKSKWELLSFALSISGPIFTPRILKNWRATEINCFWQDLGETVTFDINQLTYEVNLKENLLRNLDEEEPPEIDVFYNFVGAPVSTSGYTSIEPLNGKFMSDLNSLARVVKSSNNIELESRITKMLLLFDKRCILSLLDHKVSKVSI